MSSSRSARRLQAWLMAGLLLFAQWLAAGHAIEHGRRAASFPAAAMSTAAADPATRAAGLPSGDADALCLKCLLLSQLSSGATCSAPPAAATPGPSEWRSPVVATFDSRAPLLARARGPPTLLS